jgi:hypothetical protein
MATQETSDIGLSGNGEAIRFYRYAILLFSRI